MSRQPWLKNYRIGFLPLQKFPRFFFEKVNFFGDQNFLSKIFFPQDFICEAAGYHIVRALPTLYQIGTTDSRHAITWYDKV